MKNLFCETDVLINEADVEVHFLAPLLAALGYGAGDMSLKTSISALPVARGRTKVLYRPDFILKIGGVPAVVIDAKAPTECLEDWEPQCSSYSLEINKLFDYNPVQYFLLTNGLTTSLYDWDRKNPILTLTFEDFAPKGEKYLELIKILSKASVSKSSTLLREEIDESRFEYEAIDLEHMGEKFQKLHSLIWRSEKKSPSSAFTELMKIVFVKISKDREVHERLGNTPKPRYRDVTFSTHWISSQTEQANPVNDPLFKNLLNFLESDIASGRKKRFFDLNETINISSDTVARVVKEIEHLDFYAMEEDIHGRLFESFLDATVRGKDIGQFFTPRDVVNLMIDLADIKVSKRHIDTVLDACCGSAGFLIASMRDMLAKTRDLTGLTSTERKRIEEQIRENSIFGIDAGSDPAMYKIARMNMYLHGDGGSKIYFADSLDKSVGSIGPDSLENRRQLEEVRELIAKDGKKFDVILSNPPFSLKYKRDDPEQARVLNQYSLSIDTENGTVTNSLLSSVMFIELYKDLVAEGGRILAIIDDSVLSGESYSHIRGFIRHSFMIRAIISLPGDAFKRSSARVKTSIMILEKRIGDETQSDVFMTSARYLGLESAVARRIGVDPNKLAELKQEEHDSIVDQYAQYIQGEAGDWSVPIESLNDRLDVKYCINDRGRKRDAWKADGYAETAIGDALTIQSKRGQSLVDNADYQLLRVTYDGEIVDGEVLTLDTSSYAKLYRVETWDVLISNMGFGRGAVGIVPPHHSGKFVSNEYTIARAASHSEAVFYTNLLRTKEILADILSLTTGMNRGRIKWDAISSVSVPKCDDNDPEIQALVDELEAYWKAFGEFSRNQSKHVGALVKKFDVNGEDAHRRWLGFKPPE